MINIIERIFNAIINPRKVWRFLFILINSAFRKRDGILVIIGIDPNGILNLIHRRYKNCYGFEANPERFKKLQEKFSKYSHIKIFNAAVAQYDGEITFNISSNNNGASSSIGTFNEDWKRQIKSEKIEMVKSITVPCINLFNFCKQNNLGFIDDYVSDIQGMDLEVLKTLKPLIDEKMIGTLVCEVTKNERRNIYSDLPDNSEKGFEELLSHNYTLIAKGNGILMDNKFDKIPEKYWEMDCKWRVKK